MKPNTRSIKVYCYFPISQFRARLPVDRNLWWTFCRRKRDSLQVNHKVAGIRRQGEDRYTPSPRSSSGVQVFKKYILLFKARTQIRHDCAVLEEYQQSETKDEVSHDWLLFTLGHFYWCVNISKPGSVDSWKLSLLLVFNSWNIDGSGGPL